MCDGLKMAAFPREVSLRTLSRHLAAVTTLPRTVGEVMLRQSPGPGAYATGSSNFLFLEQPGGEKPGAMPHYPETSMLRGGPTQPRGKAAWRDRAMTGQPQLFPLPHPSPARKVHRSSSRFSSSRRGVGETKGCQRTLAARTKAPDTWSQQTIPDSCSHSEPPAQASWSRDKPSAWMPCPSP